MGKIFEQLLLAREIISQEELKYYKQLQEKEPARRHLGEILKEHDLLDDQQLRELASEEKHKKDKNKRIRKRERDEKIAIAIKQLQIVRQEDLKNCEQEVERLLAAGEENLLLAEILVKRQLLTPYLVRKLYRRGASRIPLPTGVEKHEDLVVNIPKYLRDRFLGKIAVKNELLDEEKLEECWQELKKHWPRKALGQVLLEKKIIDTRRLKTLLGVLKNSITDRYPYFKAQVRDKKLAQLLARLNFLSPWRINKCLLKQLDMLKHKEYLSLRQILLREGYLTAYQLDDILHKYRPLTVENSPSDLFVPEDEIKIIDKKEIERIVEEAQSGTADSDVHLIIDEEDIEAFDFAEDLVHQNRRDIDQDDDPLSEFEDSGNVEEYPEEEEFEEDDKESLDGDTSVDTRIVPIPDDLEDDSEVVDDFEQTTISAGEMPISLDKRTEFLTREDDMEFDVDEELALDDLAEEVTHAANFDIDMHEVLDEVTLDASEECYAEELVVDDLREIEEKKSHKQSPE